MNGAREYLHRVEAELDRLSCDLDELPDRLQRPVRQLQDLVDAEGDDAKLTAEVKPRALLRLQKTPVVALATVSLFEDPGCRRPLRERHAIAIETTGDDGQRMWEFVVTERDYAEGQVVRADHDNSVMTDPCWFKLPGSGRATPLPSCALFVGDPLTG